MGSWFSSCPIAPEPSSSIDELTDEELYALIEKRDKSNVVRPPNHWNTLITDTVWRISPEAVVKYTYSPTEAFMMSYVSSYTSIPIPKVRRILYEYPSNPHCETWWIVMDYIDGDVLETAWKTMTTWRRLCMIWTVRGYIRELQKTPIPSPDAPGPFDASGKAYLCRGTYFTEDGAGPFNSYAEMGAWFDRRRFDNLAFIHARQGIMYPCPKFDASHPLVLCHMDLHMRNFVVDGSGKLWIIDWANAGAFPPWLEYAQMVLWGRAARAEARPPKLWLWLARFMIGNYGKYTTGYLDRLGWVFDQPPRDLFPSDYFDKRGLKFD
ncbi:hypothetical protein M413DRAFT_321229 [Hebeloma cylindrosporum]|uniref:Aminoglycoside phosphotransferase domain-containing protein n=1 Tax=Hebeloma cylindrosporum TaxID=76867 RepID=A0A0C2XE57_HEBCY|nr:hypothetical protein M413DRAFT_321229 [Hebeloma cylindrosporum h7]